MAVAVEGQLYFTTPVLAPHLRDWAAMKRADHVILLDGSLWSRKGRSHRFAINMLGKKQWLALHADTQHWKGRSLHDLHWDPKNVDSMIQQWSKSLEPSYKTSYGFDELGPEWERFWLDAPSDLMECILAHGRWLANWLGLHDITQKWVRASMLEESTFQEAWFRKDVWMESGTTAYSPQPPNRTSMPAWTEPVYRQRWDPNVGDCSSLDLLFEEGPEVWRIVDQL